MVTLKVVKHSLSYGGKLHYKGASVVVNTAEAKDLLNRYPNMLELVGVMVDIDPPPADSEDEYQEYDLVEGDNVELPPLDIESTIVKPTKTSKTIKTGSAKK